MFFENSFAQELPPHHQWKKFADLDTLSCNSGFLLLQKNNDSPRCVLPSTYLKLVDRGYGNYDSSIMSKRPEMMNNLMQNIVSDKSLIKHWHETMQRNPSVMTKTMDDWTAQMKDNTELLKNLLGPITNAPELREKMIEIMKNHSHMELSLKQHSKWMDSVHQPIDNDVNHNSDNLSCVWCPEYQIHSNHENFKEILNSSHMMDMIHDMWINPGMSQDMHTLVLENPSHIALISEQMLEPMLYTVMDDVVLRQQMIELLLEHNDFMNTIRHHNPISQH